MFRSISFFDKIRNVVNYRNTRTIYAQRMVVEAMKKMETPPSPVRFLPLINEQNLKGQFWPQIKY